MKTEAETGGCSRKPRDIWSFQKPGESRKGPPQRVCRNTALLTPGLQTSSLWNGRGHISVVSSRKTLRRVLPRPSAARAPRILIRQCSLLPSYNIWPLIKATTDSELSCHKLTSETAPPTNRTAEIVIWQRNDVPGAFLDSSWPRGSLDMVWQASGVL